jgi:hypothetical protein
MKQVAGYASSLSTQIKWHGGHNENDFQNILRAGCLSLVYENGNLRKIGIGKTEILRMIYPAIRDKDWLTIKPLITQEIVEVKKDSFKIRYVCNYLSGEINFTAEYFIEGRSDNSISFRFSGIALNTFKKNRIGFCILHPIKRLAGNECAIVHSNNESEKLKFPLTISPHQPFTDIVSMRWTSEGYKFNLDFWGDVFETEDQRNWTDSSYKTYCTPLSLPFPVEVQKGNTISQRIEFKAEAETKAEAEAEVGEILLTFYPEKRNKVPAIGICRSTRPEPLTNSEIGIIRTLGFDHYRVDLYLFSTDWQSVANISVSESKKLRYPLEFALFFDDDFECQAAQFISWIKNKNINIKLINLFHKSSKTTPDSIIKIISPLFKNAIPGVMIGCGTNSNFAQLNRNRPESDIFDNLTYSIHPQEHASDNITLIENLEGQGYSVESAKHFSKGKGIWVSPVTVQRRFNANKENFEQPLINNLLPAQVDSRLMSLFGASWAAASIKYLSENGSKGISYFETVGERGIFQGDYPSRWPEDFRTVKGMIFPVYHLFKFVLGNKAFEVIKTQSSDPLKMDILTLSNGSDLKIILMNFTSKTQSILLSDLDGKFHMKQLNAGNFAEAASDPDWYKNTLSECIDTNQRILTEPFSINIIEGKGQFHIC